MILVIIICILILMARGIYRESRIKKAESNLDIIDLQEDAQSIEQENSDEKDNISNSETKEQAVKQNSNLVEEKYKGYKVAAKLKIEKLNIDTCVLGEYTKSAMQTCVTKFFRTRS